MRQPARLWRELGPAGFLGFQVTIGGTVLSALVHPWFYALAALDVANGAFLAWPGGLLGPPFWLFASLGLGLGYVAAMTLGFLALEQVRDFPILSGFPNHANSASPLLIVRWGEDYGTSLQPGFA